MKSVRTVLVTASILALVGGVGCAGQRYRTDAKFDTRYDFASVDSFAFAPKREKVAASEGGRILEQAIRDQLVARGYEEASAESADVLVSYDIGVYARAKLSGSNSFPKSEGGLNVQVLDRQTGQSVWYGWSETIVRDSDDRVEVIGAATAALFDDHIPTAD
ncbi:MAG: DUF4136 domain-containing protein [Deltaproteobacteria bacterium]|nr:DUF4136 domain-containing protein [Deltaproteobacteria bacterium]